VRADSAQPRLHLVGDTDATRCPHEFIHGSEISGRQHDLPANTRAALGQEAADAAAGPAKSLDQGANLLRVFQSRLRVVTTKQAAIIVGEGRGVYPLRCPLATRTGVLVWTDVDERRRVAVIRALEDDQVATARVRAGEPQGRRDLHLLPPNGGRRRRWGHPGQLRQPGRGESPNADGVGELIVPNFAIGAILMMNFAEQAARFCPSVEIIEMHRADKRDKPSGTAAATAERIHVGGGRADVPIHSVRMKGLLSHQEVLFSNEGELLTIRHDSFSSASFAPGIIAAIRHVRSLKTLEVGLRI